MSEAKKKPAGIKIVDGTRKELMNVTAIDRDGNFLVVKGKIFGTMPMTAKLSPAEARKAFGMLTPGLLWFLVTFLFRGSGRKKK